MTKRNRFRKYVKPEKKSTLKIMRGEIDVLQNLYKYPVYRETAQRKHGLALIDSGLCKK